MSGNEQMLNEIRDALNATSNGDPIYRRVIEFLIQQLDEREQVNRSLQTERDMYKQQMEYWRASSDVFAVEIRLLYDALKWIDRHVESRLENVNDDLQKERETYTDHQDKRKRERSVRVQNALRNDKSSLRQVQTVVQRALKVTE